MSGRALPEPSSDPLIAALDPESRRTLGHIWAERAESELKAGSGFAIVVTELYEVGADPEVLALATAAAHDEVRHSMLCRELAEAYLGEPVPAPTAKRVGMPSHPGAPADLLPHLHVVGLCCINETLAAAFVEACLETCEAPSVRAIQRQHLEDEVKHARVGWAHLASPAVDDATRQAVRAFVPRLLKANRAVWRERLGELPEAGVPGHGYPPRARLLEVVDEAIETLVRPGFAHVGC